VPEACGYICGEVYGLFGIPMLGLGLPVLGFSYLKSYSFLALVVLHVARRVDS
jgi:hypothetical protein